MEATAVFGSKLSLGSHSNLSLVRVFSRFSLKSFPRKHPKLVPMKAATNLTHVDEESNRKFRKLPSSDWGHHFLYANINVSEMHVLGKEMEALKRKVEDMLLSAKDVESIKKNILLIYLLVRLGLRYHFEDEIEETLSDGFKKIEEMMEGEDDLYTVSVIFWVFRTRGHNISSDVFKKFKGKNGKFKECLLEDAKGMLSLYEACHLGTTIDYIMDEALSFTTNHLESLDAAGANMSHMSRLIKNALYMPQHHNDEMIFAREFISSYEEATHRDTMLLGFAKLSFRFLQLHWIQELNTLTKWWKEQDLTSKLPPYFKDRMIECYFFAFGIYFEPRFSSGRIILAKLFALATLIDDTCDRYASLSEIKSLVECVERWVPNPPDSLPDYLKTIYKFVWETFQDCEREGNSNYISVQGALKEFKIYLSANLSYAEWEQGDKMPTFDEFMDVGCVEIAIYASLAFSFLGMDQIDGEKAYEWLKSRPKLTQAVSTKGRLMNDITGFEDDMSRGCLVNSVNYYMKQYGLSKEETFAVFHKMIKDTDKHMNEEFLKTAKKTPRDILLRAINCRKVTDVTYWAGEGYTNPVGKFKEYITFMFVDLMDT